LGKQFGIALSNEEYDKLVKYCKKAGATKSAVIQVLVAVYLDELIKDIGTEFAGECPECVKDVPEAENEDNFVKAEDGEVS